MTSDVQYVVGGLKCSAHVLPQNHSTINFKTVDKILLKCSLLHNGTDNMKTNYKCTIWQFLMDCITKAYLCPEWEYSSVLRWGITKSKCWNFAVIIKGLQCLTKDTKHLRKMWKPIHNVVSLYSNFLSLGFLIFEIPKSR